MVRIEKQGAVWTVIHSRFAEARNAMDPDSADALAEAFKKFDADDSASVAVLWGEGGAFCAGWDLKFASTLTDREAFQRHVVDGLAFPTGANPAPRGPLGPTRLELSKPVIAAVEGPAVAGGMELALWCDIRVMAESAYFGVYCRRWGIPLLDGGSVRLARLVGQGRAMEIILTGRKVPADEALRIGMCEQVVESRRRARRGRSDGAGDRAVSASGGAGRSPLGGGNLWPAGPRCLAAGMDQRRRGHFQGRRQRRRALCQRQGPPRRFCQDLIFLPGSRTWPKSSTSAMAVSRASR